MPSKLSRRRLVQTLGASALAQPFAPSPAAAASGSFENWPITESAATPKLCLGIAHFDPVGLRKVKQLGVDHVLRGGPAILPWRESELRSMMDTVKAAGLSLFESHDRRTSTMPFTAALAATKKSIRCNNPSVPPAALACL